MLRHSKDLYGYSIHAEDGDIGRVDQFYFDDEQWVIRYLVVDVGPWLAGRQVLIAPVAITAVDWGTHHLVVNLNKDQVRQSPSVDLHRPLTRRWQHEYHAYYEWPIYWLGTALGGASVYPSVLDSVDTASDEAASLQEDAREHTVAAQGSEADAHLQSSRDVTGYQVEATDGVAGHIADFIVDEATWAIGYLLIDTGHWLPGQKVLVPVDRIVRVSWSQGKVSVDLAQEQLKSSPRYDDDAIISPDYEAAVRVYYSDMPHA